MPPITRLAVLLPQKRPSEPSFLQATDPRNGLQSGSGDADRHYAHGVSYKAHGRGQSSISDVLTVCCGPTRINGNGSNRGSATLAEISPILRAFPEDFEATVTGVRRHRCRRRRSRFLRIRPTRSTPWIRLGPKCPSRFMRRGRTDETGRLASLSPRRVTDSRVGSLTGSSSFRLRRRPQRGGTPPPRVDRSKASQLGPGRRSGFLGDA